MAANTGRSIDKWVRVVLSDSANVLREIPVESFGDIGIEGDEVDVSALQDAIKNYLTGQGNAPIELGGPFDTAAAVAAAASGAAPALSGSYTVLQPIDRDGLPHTLQVLFGVRHNWETGESGFGLQRASASNSGYTLTSFKVSSNGGKLSYKAKFAVTGSVAPGWGTALLTAGS